MTHFEFYLNKKGFRYSVKSVYSHTNSFHFGRTHGGWGFWTPRFCLLFRKERM